MSKFEIEKKIIAALEGVGDEGRAARTRGEPWSPRADWTREIKKALVRLGNELECDVAATLEGDPNPNSGEWLFDLSWYRYAEPSTKPDRKRRRFILAVESEWDRSRKGIRIDFEKLLVARADYRLMVFEADDEAKVRDIFANLRERVEAFEQSATNDRYIFAGWDCTGQKFLFERYGFQTNFSLTKAM